jgi:hypothetical protein
MKLKAIKATPVPGHHEQEHSLMNQGFFASYVQLKRILNKAIIVIFAISISYMFNSCNSDKKQELTIEKHVELADSNFIAPIFEHGKGSANFGCYASSQPLDKEYAQSIILSSFLSNNIYLDTNFILHGISHKKWKTHEERARILDEATWDDKITNSNKFLPTDITAIDSEFIHNYIEYLTYDTIVSYKPLGYFKDANLVVIYASIADSCIITPTAAKESYMHELERLSNSNKIDVFASAKCLRQKVQKLKKYNAVVFYDPMAVPKEESEKLLRWQIDDFFVWWGKQKQ